jgi:hypothetical protein
LRATTALYYTFFLPGVLLHEVVRWLAAGFLNVQSERVIAWPEAQEIGELRLNFIRLAKDVSRFKLAVISTAPFAAGVIVVYLITNHILNMGTFVDALLSGGLEQVPDTLATMTQTPDFLLWVYITFTIANTMMPHFSELRGWWVVVGIVALAIAGLFALGAGDQIFLSNLAAPITNGLHGLAGVFVAVIAIDFVMLVLLGITEAIIERITGHSATFKNGKMITMTRDELRELRAQEAAKRERQLAKRTTAPAGPPSVYKLPLPIPDPPELSDLSSEPITIRREEPSALTPGSTPALSAAAPPAQPRPAPAIYTRGVNTPAQPAGPTPRPSAAAPAEKADADKAARDADDDDDEAAEDEIVRVPIDDDTPVEGTERIPPLDAVLDDEDDEAEEDDEIIHAPPEDPA